MQASPFPPQHEAPDPPAPAHPRIHSRQPLTHAVENDGHRQKRQPETGSQYRQRIKKQHTEQRDRQGKPRRYRSHRPDGPHHHRHHDKRTLSRNGKTGHRCIRRCRKQGDQCGGTWCRQKQRQSTGKPPQMARRKKRHTGNQPDVQAGDGHQVIGAGPDQRIPVHIIHPLSVANGERADDTGQRPPVQHGRYPVRQGFA